MFAGKQTTTMFLNPSFLAKNAQNLDSALRGRPEEVLKNIAKARALGFVGKQSGRLQNFVGKQTGNLMQFIGKQ
jgi:hypothetical protein